MISKVHPPSELANYVRQAGLDVQDITGMVYNPITRQYKLSRDVEVNYLMHTLKPV